MDSNIWQLAGPFLVLCGAGLIYSEINRLFQNTLEASFENLLDCLTGHTLKAVFGCVLFYVGYLLCDLNSGRTFHFDPSFPFLYSGEDKKRFVV